MQGIFIVLDNFENLEEQQLATLLMTFRDTLFTIPKAWWIIIGQTGLNSLVQVLDPRVAERMSGNIELAPITAEQLHLAIDRRVEKLYSKGAGKAPLPQNVHDFLYDASLGEIRFVFSYASKICLEWVSNTRRDVMKRVGPSVSPEEIAKAIGMLMVNAQIPSETAMLILQRLVQHELDGLGLRPKEKQVLEKIGKKKRATSGDFKDCGLNSGQDFSSNYLSKFYKQHLLAKRQEGARVYYSLRGIAAIGDKFELFEKVKAK